MSFLFVGALLVVLHRSDGGEVAVAPGQVTSLRSPTGAAAAKLAPPGGCIVTLTDGKFVAVLETCNEARRRLEEEINR